MKRFSGLTSSWPKRWIKDDHIHLCLNLQFMCCLSKETSRTVYAYFLEKILAWIVPYAYDLEHVHNVNLLDNYTTAKNFPFVLCYEYVVCCRPTLSSGFRLIIFVPVGWFLDILTQWSLLQYKTWDCKWRSYP